MKSIREIDTATLQGWLSSDKKFSILDIRSAEERNEWFIPRSYHIDAYQKLKQNDPKALEGITLDKSIPVVTVCARGKTSLLAAAILQEQGYDAYSLADGMRGWSLAWNKAALSFENFQIIQLRRTGKGCLSYIIVSGTEAIVVDASLPSEIYEQIIAQANWQIKGVLETHIHADHLSRSKDVAARFGVPLLLPASNRAAFRHDKLTDGEIIQLGKISIKVISTPGHTLESICFLVDDKALISGDTVFVNSVGRPDLKADEEEAKTRAGLLYDSLQKIMQMPGDIVVLPGHTNYPVDFDEKPVAASISDIKNMAMLRLGKDEFIKTILDKLPPAPENHLVIAESNMTGNISSLDLMDIEAGANRCAVS